MNTIITRSLLLLLTLWATGCKVQIEVPEGGSVVSSSGARDCASGRTCSFDVVDVFFEDTFNGEAEEGFAFAGWQRGNSTFCGGSGKACFLSTANFVGNPDLLAVLESDRTFFLRPLFVKKSGGGNIVNRPMKACVDRAMYQAGYRSDITVQLYDDGRRAGTRRTVSTVSGPQQYKGRSVMLLNEDITTRGPLNSEMAITTYNLVDLAASRIRTIGIDQSSTMPVAQEVEGTITPAFLQRFDLKVGDSYTTSYTINLSFPDGGSPDITQDISTEFIYEGVETITIPAGTFDACRVRRFDDIDGQVAESYNWIGRGNGVLLLESDSAFVPEAAVMSGSIGGQAL